MTSPKLPGEEPERRTDKPTPTPVRKPLEKPVEKPVPVKTLESISTNYLRVCDESYDVRDFYKPEC